MTHFFSFFQVEGIKDFWQRNWGWASGGLFGAIYGIKTFPMEIPYLYIDWTLVTQLAQVFGLAVLGGAGTSLGKWGIDHLRSKISKKKKEDTNP